jgi:hypothetical protein
MDGVGALEEELNDKLLVYFNCLWSLGVMDCNLKLKPLEEHLAKWNNRCLAYQLDTFREKLLRGEVVCIRFDSHHSAKYSLRKDNLE